MSTLSLRHYAAAVIELDREREYTQRELSAYAKPRGFWVSVPGEDDWPTWCKSEGFGLDRLAVEHVVTLSADANILTIPTPDLLDAFTETYGVTRRRARGGVVVIRFEVRAMGFGGYRRASGVVPHAGQASFRVSIGGHDAGDVVVPLGDVLVVFQPDEVAGWSAVYEVQLTPEPSCALPLTDVVNAHRLIQMLDHAIQWWRASTVRMQNRAAPAAEAVLHVD